MSAVGPGCVKTQWYFSWLGQSDTLCRESRW